MSKEILTGQGSWPIGKKIGVLASFLFTLAVVVPLDPAQAIRHAISIGVPNRYYLGSFLSRSGSDRDYTNIIIAILVFSALAFAWTFIDRKRRSYETLYYWTWVLARYKVADVMFWFGIEKVFPIQMPAPTLSYLNTNLGDIHPWKLYWLTTGAAPGFEMFCGAFEVLAAALLIFRRTATLGALAMLAITVPIIAVNVGYDAGVQRPATLILLLLAIIISYDFKGLWDFWVLRKQAALHNPPAIFNSAPQKYARHILFAVFVISTVVLRGIGMYDWYSKGESDKLPKEKGIPGFYGYYRVPQFSVNGKELPYSYTDRLRWQDVVFEKWNTITVKTARPVHVKKVRQATRPLKETLGVAGRHYYYYKADTVSSKLNLTYKSDSTESFHFHYIKQEGSLLKLSGVNEKGDSLKITLEKIDKQYPLIDGRQNKTYNP